MNRFCRSHLTLILLVLLGYIPNVLGEGPAGATEPIGPAQGPAIGGILSQGGNVDGGGLGIQPDEFSGAATFSYPIALPPGRGGLTPQLTLDYNSHRRNANGWVGYGWDLAMGEVIRTPGGDGSVNYQNGEHFEVRLLGQSEKLIRVETGASAADFGVQVPGGAQIDRYEARVNTSRNIYLHLYNATNDFGWIVIDKNGTRYEFGTGAANDAMIQLTQDRLNENNNLIVARWFLERVTDTNGNTILIKYGNKPQGVNFPYSDFRPREILYGDIRIVITKYHPAMTAYFPAFRDGFVQPLQGSQLNSIEIYHDGAGGGKRLQMYLFDYTVSTTNFARLLTQIQRFGQNNSETLPAVTFKYYGDYSISFDSQVGSVAVTQQYADGSQNKGYVGVGNLLTDMNGDGVPDYVAAFDKGVIAVKYMNNKLNTVDWKEYSDPLKNICSNNTCLGKLNTIYTDKSGFTEWIFMMDMNGDSFPDRVMRRSGGVAGKSKIHIAYANPDNGGWALGLDSWIDPYSKDDPGVGDYSAGLMDMNGDGLPDRIVGEHDKGEFKVYLNMGNGFNPVPQVWKDPLASGWTQPGKKHPAQGRIDAYENGKQYVGIRDVNGDGLPDRVFRIKLYVANGGGGFTEEFGLEYAMNLNGRQWAIPVPSAGKCGQGVDGCTYFNAMTTLGMQDPMQNPNERGYISSDDYDLIDFNNDGYLDRVESDAKLKGFWVTHYTGIQPESNIVQFHPKASHFFSDPVKDAGGTQLAATAKVVAKTDDGMHAFFRDVDGDGFPDRIQITPASFWAVGKQYEARFMKVHRAEKNKILFDIKGNFGFISVNQQPNALESIDNGQGLKMAVEYVPSTALDYVKNRFLPSVMQVLHVLYTSDSEAPWSLLQKAKRHPGMRWSTYTYSGGNVYMTQDYLPAPRYVSRFNGFQCVKKTTDPMPGDSWQSYFTETCYHQAKGAVTLPNDADFEWKSYTHIALSGKPYRKYVQEGKEPLSITDYKWILLNLGVDPANPHCFNEGCRPVLSELKQDFRESNFLFGNVSTRTFGYDIYGNLITEILVDGNTTLYKKDRKYYDTSKFGKLLIRNRVHTEQLSSGATVVRRSEIDYDSSGNAIKERYFSSPTESLQLNRIFGNFGNVIGWTGTDGVAHVIGYDTDQVFPTSESITLPSGTLLTTTRSYHRMTGAVSMERDPHGVGVKTDYDSFGRPVEESLISVSGTMQAARKWSYQYMQGLNTTLLKTTMWQWKFDGSPWLVEYRDGYGRVRQSSRLSEQGNYRTISSKIYEAGRSVEQTNPSFTATPNVVPALSGPSTTTTLDIRGRPILITPPAGDVGSPTAPTKIVYTMSAVGDHPHVTKLTLPNGQVRISESDALWRVRLVKEGFAGENAVYDYNAAGDLLKVTIGGKVQQSTDYDMLGRKLATTDADLGKWVYAYDNLGHLTNQVDAGNQAIQFTYDAVGRVEEKRYFTSSGDLQKYETYSYDTGVGGFDVLPGELGQVAEKLKNGTLLRNSSFSYDSSYRRIAKMQREIPGVGKFDQKFVHNYKGQLTSTEYPGKETIHYSYNSTDGLKSICNTSTCDDQYYYHLDPKDAFDEFGSVVKDRFGNGVETDIGYYPNTHRLLTRVTRSGPDKIYSDRVYQYDVMSNVKVLADPSQQLGGSTIDAAKYDSQDRLLSSTSKGESSTYKYAISGNISQNDASFPGQTYEYASARPHAVTQIGSNAFLYDANGNMVKDSSRTMTYSAANQLTQVKMTNGSVVDLDYDFTGARVSKTAVMKDGEGKSWRTRTHYLGEALEVKYPAEQLDASGKVTIPVPKDSAMVTLHIFAGGQKIASKTLGKLSVVIPAGAGFILPLPWGNGLYLPLPWGEGWGEGAVHYTAFAALLALLIVAFPRVRHPRIVMPDVIRHPGHAAFPLTQGLSKGAVVALVLIVTQITTPALTFAGDTGTVKIPPSDTLYLVYYHGDHLGSDHIITEGKKTGKHAGITYKKGDVIQRFEYAPYGKESFALNPNIQFDPAYTGQKYDIETGLYYYKARYYDPILGRFIQPDTIVQNTYDPQSWNRYAYVRNNPLKYVDPSGHVIEIQLDDNGPAPENTGRSDASDRASLDRGGSSDTGGLVGAAVRTVTSGVSSYANYWVSSQVAGYGAIANGVGNVLDHLQIFKPDLQLTPMEDYVISSVIGMAGGVKIVNQPRLLLGGSRVANAGGRIVSLVTKEQQIFYRVFSGNNAKGSFLTAVRPESSAWAREALALPPGNQATFVQEVIVPAGTRLQRSRSLPAFGRRGGAEQFEILEKIPIENFGPGVPLP